MGEQYEESHRNIIIVAKAIPQIVLELNKYYISRIRPNSMLSKEAQMWIVSSSQHMPLLIIQIAILINIYISYYKCLNSNIKMSNIQQFKHQTFTLIKQQATKLKSNTKELEIKEQQIRLLKQTIDALEDQREQSERIKFNLKSKIDLIMRQVANYNDNVVIKLQNDNQILQRKVMQLSANLQENFQTTRRLTKQLQISEDKLLKISGQADKMKQSSLSQNKQCQKLKNENVKLKQVVGEQQKRINKLEAQNQQYEAKIKSNQKQIDVMVSKCQQTVNSYEKKLRNLKQGLVKKQQIHKVQSELQKYIKKSQQQKKQLQRLNRQKNEISLNTKISKQRECSNQMKNQMEKSILEADIRNLKDSCKIGKKVVEFQSKYSQMFYQIFQTFYNSHCLKQQHDKRAELLQDRVNELERIINQKQTILEQSKNELQMMGQKLRTQAQSIQSSYEGKILQLSLKIKKQEKALHQLAIKDRQFQNLNEQYQKLAQEHASMKQSLQDTINQYRKQNDKLTSEVQQLIQLCDQNINTKNSLNCLKYSISNLIAVIYFLHLNLVRARQSRRKIYQPFIDFYFKTRYALQGNKKPKIRRFRSCVIAIMAFKRMEKSSKQASYSGLFRYADKALKRKGKIQDFSQYLSQLLQKAIKNEKNIIQLLRQNKNVYKWNCLNNYLKVNIPTNWYISALKQERQ